MHRLGYSLVSLYLWWRFLPFTHLRLTGVLPRIALCYCVVSFVALYVNHKYIGWIIGCLIAGYAVLLCIGNGYAPDDTNLLAIIDRNVLGADHLYHKSPIDPEGLTSTLSAIAHTLIGFCCGKTFWLRKLWNRKHWNCLLQVLFWWHAVLCWQKPYRWISVFGRLHLC